MTKDFLSELDFEFFNLFVFNFFPNSTRGYASEKEDTCAIEERIKYSGSVAEHLNIPDVWRKSTGKMHPPDRDIMHVMKFLNGPSDFVIKYDEKYPLHCTLELKKKLGNIGNIGNNMTEFLDKIQNLDLISILKYMHFTKHGMVHEKANFNDVDIKVETANEYYNDHVPTLEIECPSFVLQNLKHRCNILKERPSCLSKFHTVVKVLQNQNIHVVYKPHMQCSNPSNQWRISFSVMEVKLARSLNDTQKTAYRVLKALVLVKINDRIDEEDHKLPSYFLKTALFWVCVDLPKGFCIYKNIGKVFFALLDKLIQFFKDNNFPHFFIPEGNLLDQYPVQTVKTWMDLLWKLRCNPTDAMLEFWDNYYLATLGYTEYVSYFKEYLKLQKLQQCLDSSGAFHIMNLNLVDYMRLWHYIKDVFCFCKKTKIVDFFHGCQKCFVAKFCDTTSEQAYQQHPYILPILANMWFVRSLHNGVDSYERKTIEIFNQTQKYIMDPSVFQQYHIHFALYLLAKRNYTDAVCTIIKFLLSSIDLTSWEKRVIYIPCFLSDMLDNILQIELSGKSEKVFSSIDLAYHILSSCYIHAGVCSEIIFANEENTLYLKKQWDSLPSYTKKVSPNYYPNIVFYLIAEHVGDQYFLCKDYYQAAQWYIAQRRNEEGVHIKSKFLVCMAKLFKRRNFENSVQTYLRQKY